VVADRFACSTVNRKCFSLCYCSVTYVIDVTGEHIDYSGYAVLPMAIEQDIVIAAAADPSSMQLQLTNTNTEYQ